LSERLEVASGRSHSA